MAGIFLDGSIGDIKIVYTVTKTGIIRYKDVRKKEHAVTFLISYCVLYTRHINNCHALFICFRWILNRGHQRM